MKIIDNTQKKGRFEELKLGEIFESNGRFFLKLKEVQVDIEHFGIRPRNTCYLDKKYAGVLGYFDAGAFVSFYPSELHIGHKEK